MALHLTSIEADENQCDHGWPESSCRTCADLMTAIPQPQPQTQAALNDQLLALHGAANSLGLFDAADWLRKFLKPPSNV